MTDELSYTGDVLVYFNAHATAPLVWCVSNPKRTWELAVKSVVIDGALAVTAYDPTVVRKADHSGPPSAVIRVFGRLQMINGSAVIGD